MGNWIKGLFFISIVIALIAAGILLWGGLDNYYWYYYVDATILIVALLVILVGCARLALGPVESFTCDGLKSCVAWALALGGGALVIFVLVWAMWKFTGPNANSAIGLPLIVIVGVITLLIVISLVTFVFSVLGLASINQALGLPDGSVRSIIALMLLVLFSIVAIYLYNSVAGVGPVEMLTVPEAQVAALRTQINVVATLPDTTAGMTKVYYSKGSTPAGQDLAKQLIVLLGTLVTAVASFYFGSNAVASAQAAISGQQNGGPVVTDVNPKPAIKPSKDEQPLTLTGHNLAKVKKVSLQGPTNSDAKQTIDAKTLDHSSDTTVVARLTIPEGTSNGDWNILVVEDDPKHSINVHTVKIQS